MPTTEKPDRSTVSTFASRRAEREAREAAGETPPERRRTSLRAGHDAPQPVMEVTSVQA
jgi:hypothetical protein